MRRATCILFLACLPGAGALAQTAAATQPVEPAWLVVNRADRLSDAGAFGRAIQLYRRALDLDPGNPEALLGMGRAFKAVGDYGVAEDYFRDALDGADRLVVPDAVFDINYELAGVFRVQRRFAQYETTLAGIVELAAISMPAGTLRRVLRDQGLDRLLVLYRLPEDGATRARGDMAELLVGLGRYPSAAESGIVAVVQQLSTVIEAILARDPDFQFESVAGALSVADAYPETRDYLAQSAIYRDIYYLAAALFGEGYRQIAASLWRLVAEAPQAGEMAVRARIQLNDPRTEPLIVLPLP